MLKLIKQVFYLFCLLPLLALAQSSQIGDSLRSILSAEIHDSTKLFVYIELSKEYQTIDLDTAYFYGNEGLILAKQLNLYYGLAEAYANLGDMEVVKGNLDQAKELYLKSTNYFKIVNRKGDLVQVYLVLGNIFLAQDNYFNALQTYHNGLEIAEKIDFQSAMEFLYINLGLTYNMIYKTDMALEFLEKALIVSKESSNKESMANVFINIGSIYYTKMEYPLAKSYYEKARKIAKEMGNHAFESNALNHIGEIYQKENKYELAQDYYKEALIIAEKVKDDYKGPKSMLFASTFSHIGTIYFLQNEIPKAIDYLKKGYDLGNEIGRLSIVSNNAELLSLIYEDLKKHEIALEYSRIHKSTSDSLLNEDNIKKIAQLELQYEFDQQLKEAELEQIKKDAVQKRKELIYIIIAVGSIFGLLVFILLYLLSKNKVRRIELNEKNLKLEKDKLQSDLEYKNKELTTNVMYLLKKNEFIMNITEKLKIAKIDFKIENKKVVADIIRELESSTTSDTWKEFELRFQEVHMEFYKKLNSLHPDLSPNEQKLSAFLRLNMSTKEIATITYLTVNSINIARHRLRKKLNIEHEENLVNYLSQL